MADHALDPKDLRNLQTLRVEFESLCHAITLARTLAVSGAGFHSPNPVIRFAFQRAEEHVVERTLLRMAEAIEILDRVLVALGDASLFTGKGRDRRPCNLILGYAYKLRQDWIAHRVSIGQLATTWNKVQSQFGDIWSLLNLLMTTIDAHLRAVEGKGGLPSLGSDWVVIRRHADFTAADVDALVAAAPPPSDPGAA